MKLLFVIIPFIEFKQGQIWTGPGPASCWPHTQPGLYSYVPFPFMSSYACRYAQLNAIDASLYDGWAKRRTDYDTVHADINALNPEIIVIETASPMMPLILQAAERLKRELLCKIVLTGPHVDAYADELLALPYVDAVVIGEADIPCVKIANGDKTRKFTHEYPKDVDKAGGINWTPYRNPEVLRNYRDPSLVDNYLQIQMNTSRSCPWACTFCQWVSSGYSKYRRRSVPMVLEELRELKRDYPEFRSLFLDDEVFNINDRWIKEFCEGVKPMGLDIAMMGRIDSCSRESYDIMADAGCRSWRFGLESFHGHLLEKVNKKLDPKESWDNCVWLATHFTNTRVRMLTMRHLPGETLAEEQEDDRKFEYLQRLAMEHGNRWDRQVSNMVCLPGTPSWRDEIAAGERHKMEDFFEYNAHPDGGAVLAKKLGDYAAITIKGKTVETGP